MPGSDGECVGIGGDPIIGSTFLDVLELFAAVPRPRPSS